MFINMLYYEQMAKYLNLTRNKTLPFLSELCAVLLPLNFCKFPKDLSLPFLESEVFGSSEFPTATKVRNEYHTKFLDSKASSKTSTTKIAFEYSQ